MPANSGDNRILEVDIARIGKDDAERLGRHRMRPGDIVYSRRGDVGRRALVRAPQSDWLCGTGCLLVRVGDTHVDPAHVSFWLGTQQSRAWVAQHAIGATMPNLSTAILSAVPISLPPPAEQRGIAATLGALDDMIESNRRLADLIPRLLAAKIVASMATDSRRVRVADLARFVNGGAFTKGATGSGRIVIRIAELNSGPGRSTVYNELYVPDDKLARPGDLLMSWSGSLNVYRWVRTEAIINQHIFKVVPVDVPPWLIYDRLLRVMPVFSAIAHDKATTMGHIQRGHLESTHVEPPTAVETSALGNSCDPL